jgi:predicted dehydrogenase
MSFLERRHFSLKKVRYGMVGGGLGSYIGDVHRHGAMMDDLAVLCAGCFSRHRDKNLETADAWEIPEDRVYANYQEMADKESSRDDGIDFVTIATPNSSHYEIAKCFLEKDIHVLCDKPVTLTVAQAEDLKKIAEKRHLLFAVPYAYTAYPVIRQGRQMIEDGVIGKIIYVRVGHPEDWVISSVPEEPSGKLPWRFDPKMAGESLCSADLGTHAEQLLEQFTGLTIKRLLAKFNTWPAYLPLETNVTALLDLGDGISGELWASQIALGKSCSPHILVIGSKGSLEWDHEKPDLLRYRKVNGCIEILESGKDYMCEASRNLNFVSPGHHEGFYEAFGSVYRSFIECLNAKLQNRDPGTYRFPTVRDGADGMRFIAACMKSVRNGNTWTEV